ncbi:hypothetical protein AGABI1DRAFT_29914, partial [Agaricus bisporus var. burnettii JB137-S8]
TLNSITTLLNPPRTSLNQLLQERASANHHLSRTLNLTNTFVDADPDVHTRFVQHSHTLLKHANSSGWARFQETCSQAVDLSLNEYPSLILSDTTNGEDIPFDHFVQIVVLRTILAGLLDIGKDVDELDIRSLASVTTIINQLWTYSKSPGNTNKETSSSLSQRLQSHLRQLVPPESGLSNPIDFVVPTWETLWRVCATLIARIQEDQSYEDVFHEFLHAETPINRQFNVSVNPYGFSVRDFVVESMRLHPPVKRISRFQTHSTSSNDHHHIFRSSPIPGPTRVVADIEKVLRDPEIWSEDAPFFNPRRHREQLQSKVGVHEQIRAQAETLKLVFGHGPLRCVAASWAPVAAAVIGATIVGQIREGGFEVVVGDRIGGRVGWGGWKV